MKLRAVLSAAVLLAAAASTAAAAAAGACDVYRGRWVLDESYPLYDSGRCPFVRRQFDCRRGGRPDELYLRYRWQPDPPCPPRLPRFDGRALLRAWRGKVAMFVGDSLVVNQYESLLCMLHAAAPGTRTTMGSGKKLGPSTSVRFEGDYNVTLVYYRTSYLVDIVNKKDGRVLKLDSLEEGRNWLGADVLVFGSWHWWPRSGLTTQPWDYIQEGDTVVKDMNRTLAFTKALRTWAAWVDTNLVKTKTKVFFQGITPNHYWGDYRECRGPEWGGSPWKTCKGETRPLNGTAPYPGGPVRQEAALRSVLARMAKPVHLLDITFLSQQRMDAHPSNYTGGVNADDCSHWCVPGLPTTWNVLFYAALTGR
ncbi:hypothetical protein ACP70R_006488 [Stipagrostis hirtigluma subsp. patula]